MAAMWPQNGGGKDRLLRDRERETPGRRRSVSPNDRPRSRTTYSDEDRRPRSASPPRRSTPRESTPPRASRTHSHDRDREHDRNPPDRYDRDTGRYEDVDRDLGREDRDTPAIREDSPISALDSIHSEPVNGFKRRGEDSYRERPRRLSMAEGRALRRSVERAEKEAQEMINRRKESQKRMFYTRNRRRVKNMDR